ncbi:MAG: sigma-54 dependent transcriptional regulator [Candidatus Aminicenantes bacterium]|nr:sigma-54 dependent transcriptional regulator [Candidatus Aminicenantes bacterium]
MSFRPDLLILAEESAAYAWVKDKLGPGCGQVHTCRKQDNILQVLKNHPVRVALLDCGGEEAWDYKLLEMIKAFDNLIELVVVGPAVPSEKIMDWIARGASDYLLRPLETHHLSLILERLEEKCQLKKETFQLEKELEKKYVFQGIIGKSPFMLDVFTRLETVARYFSTVLITGETGTGKELAAKALHTLSPVRNKKLVVSDCASIPDSLFESELFGFVKGAFTGADRDKKGLVEEAQDGTLLLDEIGEVPLPVQAKLLRVMEEREIRPLGSNQTREVNFRAIATTNRDLRQEAARGKFREDLFHRFGKMEIHLPPLRDRVEDVPLLMRAFLDRYNKKFQKNIRGVSRNVQKLFLKYAWPGNIRELLNVMESAAMLCGRDFLDIGDLPKYLQELSAVSEESLFSRAQSPASLEQLEKEYIAYLLKTNRNNIRRTAKLLNISRSTLYQKIRKYGISFDRTAKP